MASVDFIYFDLGKVILDFDHDIGCQSVSKVAGISPTQAKEAIFDSGLEDKFETGLVSSDEFYESFCQTTNSQPDKNALMRGISDIFVANIQMFPVITQLRAINFPMGILSNTCQAHWDFVFANYTVLQHFFSPMILSYEVNSMKPDSKIYDRAIEMAGCHVKNCFFVDDKPENVEGAIAAGMDAVLCRSVSELVDQLKTRGVEINL